MTSSTLDALVERYQQVSVSNQRMLGAFGRLAMDLHRAGIDFILLKGADVLPRLYGIWGLRSFCDVDLLTHERDLSRLDELLTGAGFTPEIDGNPSYYSAEQGLRLDIVTSLWYLDASALQKVWERAELHTQPQPAYRALASDDLLIYLIAYNVIHRGHISSVFWNDLRLLTTKEHMNWDRIIETAKRHHLKVPVYYALTTGQALPRPLAFPSEALHQLRPITSYERWLYRLLRRVLRSEELHGLGHLLLLISRPPRTWAMGLLGSFFPSSSFLSYRYGAAAQIHPISTRIRRWFALTQAAVRLLLKVARQGNRPKHTGAAL